MATRGKVEIIRLLAKDLRLRPLNLRMTVVDTFGDSDYRTAFSKGLGPSPTPENKDRPDDPKAVRAAIDQLLVDALDDTEEQTGVGGSREGKEYHDPRVCDIAAHVLSLLEPARYTFDLSAPPAKRNRDIAELRNAWRKTQGLPPLPVPALRTIHAVPDEKLRPLLDRLLKNPTAERSSLEAQIVDLGLGALPGIRKRLEKMNKPGDPDRAVLEWIASRVACIVVDVVIEDSSVNPGATQMTQLEGMKGKSFNAELFQESVRLLVKDLPKGVHALRFGVDRAGDGTGVMVKVALLDEKRARQLERSDSSPHVPHAFRFPPAAWDYRQRGDMLGTQEWKFGNCSHALWLKDDPTDLHGLLSQACSSAPDKAIRVRLQLIADFGK